jgi:hypothetical protein
VVGGSFGFAKLMDKIGIENYIQLQSQPAGGG